MTQTVSQSDYIRLGKACDLLNWQGPRREERLLRTLRAKEHRLKVEILIPIGKRDRGDRGVKYRVTLKSLRRYCRELFLPEPREMMPQIRALMSDIDQRIDDRIDEKTGAQFAEIDTKIEMLSEAIVTLGKNVSKDPPGLRVATPRDNAPQRAGTEG